MYNKGDKVNVVCDRFGRPNIEGHQILQGSIELVGCTSDLTKIYSVYVENPSGWIITAVEDESLLMRRHNV